MNSEKLSRFMAKVLRHNPGLLKIWIDDQGWTDFDFFTKKISSMEDFKDVDKEKIKSIVKDNSDIFEIKNNKIRCKRGHSLSYVKVGFEEAIPPRFLFFACNENEKDIVLSRGAFPMGKNKFVGLFLDENTMMDTIKRRHGKSFFKVYALDMVEDGKKFYSRDDKKGMFYIETIHPKFIKEVSNI